MPNNELNHIELNQDGVLQQLHHHRLRIHSGNINVDFTIVQIFGDINDKSDGFYFLIDFPDTLNIPGQFKGALNSADDTLHKHFSFVQITYSSHKEAAQAAVTVIEQVVTMRHFD